MKIIKLQVGSLGTNCYIVYCETTAKAALIDPGGNAAEILARINREGLELECIINTHGHADHIMENLKVKAVTNAPLLIHVDDADMLVNAHRNLSTYVGSVDAFGPADRLLREGEIIHVGKVELTVIHTPGHTPGGICLLAGDVLFSGDTLFAESIGRTDFPGGSYKQLIHSIKEKLMVLPDHVKVLPGHGSETTIGWERVHNPFIQ